MDHLVFEVGLALALVAGAVLLAARFRFSNVPLLILIGMAVGPHTQKIWIMDFRFIESAPLIEFMGRVGVLFLLFYLGLEFSVKRLIKSGRSIVVGGSIYIIINFVAGLGYALLMGWPVLEALVAAGITTISSSAIIAKVLFDLRRTANPETELIFSITMFQDIFLALYLAHLRHYLKRRDFAWRCVDLFGHRAGFHIRPDRFRKTGYAPVQSVFSHPFKRSILIDTVCEPVFAGRIRRNDSCGRGRWRVAFGVGSLRDRARSANRTTDRAVSGFLRRSFFFSFGLTIDPLTLGGAVWIALGAVIVTLVGNVAAGILAGRSAGLSPEASMNIGLTIVSRGEFSIIMAELAKTGNLLPVLQPFSALYVLILAVLGPLMTKESERIYNLSAKLFRWRSARRAKAKQRRFDVAKPTF